MGDDGELLTNQRLEIKWSPTHQVQHCDVDICAGAKNGENILWRQKMETRCCSFCSYGGGVIMVLHIPLKQMFAFVSYQLSCLTYTSDDHQATAYISSSVDDLYSFCMDPHERREFEKAVLQPFHKIQTTLQPHLPDVLVSLALSLLQPIFPFLQ